MSVMSILSALARTGGGEEGFGDAVREWREFRADVASIRRDMRRIADALDAPDGPGQAQEGKENER